MMMSTARSLAVEKIMTKCYVECGEVDTLELGIRKINHYHRLAARQARIYRNGRRNALYSK